jgi:hypothetical protein
MGEVMFVVSGDGEQFLVMALDGSVTRYRAQGWGIERMDPTGQFVIGNERGEWADGKEAQDPGGDPRGEAPADR